MCGQFMATHGIYANSWWLFQLLRVLTTLSSRWRFMATYCDLWASGKLVTIKISHCYKVYRKGCNSYKQCVVSILLQHVFVVTILLQHIILVTMRIGCNNVKIKYLLLQRLINVVTQIFVATMNGICCNWQIFGPDLFDIYRGGGGGGGWGVAQNRGS